MLLAKFTRSSVVRIYMLDFSMHTLNFVGSGGRGFQTRRLFGLDTEGKQQEGHRAQDTDAGHDVRSLPVSQCDTSMAS